MPVFGGDDREDRSTRTHVLLAVGALAVLWLAFQTGVLKAVLGGPLALLTANPSLTLGLAVIAAVGWWALDEAEADDAAEDVIEKTGDRASRSLGGVLSGTTTLAAAGLTVAATVGNQLVAMLGGFLDQVLAMPLAALNVGLLGGILALGRGLLRPQSLLLLGAAGLLLALVARRREGS